MNMQDKVSMVMTCYNKAEYIGSMFDSIIEQEWNNIELILVNDGSTDNTQKVMERYRPKFMNRGYEVVIVNQENAGVCTAAKAGLEKITGEYICCVDADDELDPRYCSFMAGSLKENDEYDYCICNSKHFIMENGQKKWLPVHFDVPSENTENIIFEWIFGEYECSVWRYMIRRDYYEKCRITENYFVDTRWSHEPFIAVPLLAYQGKYKCIDIPLYFFREVDESHSRSKSEAYRLCFRENYSNLILIAVDRLDPQFVDERRKEKFRTCIEFERRVQELTITGKIKDAVNFRKLFEFFEPCHLLYNMIERAIRFEVEDCLIPALKDYLLGQKSYNRIIEYAAKSAWAEWFVQFNEEGDAAEFWDLRGDGVKILKPDFDSLDDDDLILILPSSKNDEIFADVTSQAKRGRIVGAEDTKKIHVLKIIFPELYLTKHRETIKWKPGTSK